MIIGSCSNKQENTEQITLTISAAISLSDVLAELKQLYESDNEHIEITYNFGGSGTLAQQIQQGAPVDLFISANDQWMDTLTSDQLIIDDSLTTIATNELVMIGQSENNDSDVPFEQLLTEDNPTIAIGHPDTVPAGIYAKQSLEALNLYHTLQEHIIFAKDVRQVLTYVDTGNAHYGFVYKSDAYTSDTSEIITTLEDTLHEQIAYPAAIIADTKYEKEAINFLSFLTSDTAQDILKNYGFSHE